MNNLHFTPYAIHAIDVAVETARQRHNKLIGTEHLLIGVLNTDIVREAMQTSGGSVDALLAAVTAELGMIREKALEKVDGFTREARDYFLHAEAIAESLGHRYLCSGHLFLAILRMPDTFLKDILAKLPAASYEQLETYIKAHSKPPSAATLSHWRPAVWENSELIQEVFAKPSPARSSPAPVLATKTTSGSTRSTGRKSSDVYKPHQTVVVARKQADNTRTLIWIGVALLVAIVYGLLIAPTILLAVMVVLVGWIFSVSAHEFGHALVAYWGGDHTVVQKGYLTFNPLRYAHPVTSIAFPLVILFMGGIGLPGGAVYIEYHRLRNKWWGAAVSAAGPAATALCILLFSAPFWSGYVTIERFFDRQVLWAAVAFLVWLNSIALIFNLLPIPPLDGFGILEPFLPDPVADQLRPLGSIGFLLIFMLFFIPSEANPLRVIVGSANDIAQSLDIDLYYVQEGYENFRFWDPE